MIDYKKAMLEALEVAESATASGDVPVGAVVFNAEGQLVGVGHNLRERNCDPTAHAEVIAIREAALKAGTWRLDNHTLVVTLEPCAMCAGAIAQSRMKTLVFGAWDEKAGAVGSVWDILRDPRAIHQVEVISGIMEAECAELLITFFKQQR
ncbi:MAG: tRNA adenosine(34) deaminase TadA [Actinomycetes bacterium]